MFNGEWRMNLFRLFLSLPRRYWRGWESHGWERRVLCNFPLPQA